MRKSSLPADRLLYQDVQGLVEAHLIAWTRHRYLRTVQGHKHIREVEVTAAGQLTSWDGFLEAAARYGVTDAALWACLIHDVTTQETAQEPPMGLVSTRRWRDGFAALQAYRPRWHIEDDTYRELKEGWGLEKQHWGRDLAAARGRITLTCLAFNTAQVYRLQAGEQLASVGIRRLRRHHQRELGAAPAVIYLADCYGVFSLEELLHLLGTPPRESLLPALSKASSPDAPTRCLISKCLGLEVAEVPTPVSFVRPLRQYAVRTSSKEHQGGYSHAVVLSSRTDLSMTGVVEHSDGRAWTEADRKRDKHGLGRAPIRKRLLPARDAGRAAGAVGPHYLDVGTAVARQARAPLV